MKRNFVIFFVILAFVIGFSEINWSINFSIHFGDFSQIPDYGLVIDVGVPFIEVYVDDFYAGTTNIFGYLVLNFKEEGFHTIRVEGESYLESSVVVYVEKTGKIVKIPVEKAGKLAIFTNVYPVNIYANGKYYGVVRNNNEEIKLPCGEFLVTFESPGYNPIVKRVLVEFDNISAVELAFEKLELSMNIRSEYDEFSPNNDWYNDKWVLEIFLSTYATVTVNIFDENNQLVYTDSFYGKPNLNIFTWNGIERDGLYKVEVVADDGKTSCKKETSVVINNKHYTYLKEIIVSSVVLMFGTIIYFILK